MKAFVTVMMIVFLGFAVYFLNPSAWADAPAVPKMAKPQGTSVETKELMGKFLNQMSELKKYFTSEETFNDPKNTQDIALHLKQLTELTKRTAHDPQLAQENYKLSRQVLINHVTETERVFRTGNKSYARWMLNSTLSLCMSCHTQIPSASRQMKDFEDAKSFTNQFDQAEFFFATRAFDKASEIYSQLAQHYPEGNIKTEDLETALERQVAYFSRVKRNPERAIKEFEKIQRNKKLPEYLKNDIQAWLLQFRNWSKHPALDPRTADDNAILEFAQKNLNAKETNLTLAADNPQLVNHLKTSGVLFEYLQYHPHSKVTAQILYWLSICDRTISNNFFYSLADLYLRECILNYAYDPIAKKCYQEFEDEMVVSYSGSGGTNLPDAVKQDLKSLKTMVESGGAVKVHEN